MNVRHCYEYRESSLLCFSETWLHPSIPDSQFEVEGFTLVRSDRTEDSGKSRGGGVCAFINDKWCRQFTIKNKICTSDVEVLCLTLRPFYLPREFGCVILCVIYAPPSGNSTRAAYAISDCVNECQQQHPEAPVVLLGDYNQCRLEKAMPGFVQVIKCSTRKDKILDMCYTNIKNAYSSRAKPPIANSDHNAVHLIPVYKTKLKSSKPVEKTVRVWSEDSIETLKGSYLCTDWEVFREDDTDHTITVTTDYMNFCVEAIPTKIVKVYPNSKSYIDSDIKKVLKEKKTAFKNNNTAEVKRIQKRLNHMIREGRQKHRQKLENAFSSSNTKLAWQTMKNMAGMSTPHKPLHAEDELAFANELNTFYKRFDTDKHFHDCMAVLESIPRSNVDTINITAEQVTEVFKHLNPRKACGPDKVTPHLLKICAEELGPVWQPIYQQTLNSEVPTVWKTSHIIPIPKKPCPKENNDYRPIALTSVLIKALEKLVVQHFLPTVESKLDPYQFAYRRERSTEDAVATLSHLITKHLEDPQAFARALFIDFSSAFNTIKPHLLLEKMKNLDINPHIIHFYHSFLTGRVQQVRVNNTLSPPVTTNIGAPQGCVSSSIFFILYTNDCTTSTKNQYTIKFSDDTVLLALMNNDNDISSYVDSVNKLVQWCDENALVLNVSKTEEVIFDPRSIADRGQIKIHNIPIKQVESYKYLGVWVDHNLSWSFQVDHVCAKVQQRMYFLRRLRAYGASAEILKLFYCSTIQSIIQYCGTVWYNSLTVQAKNRVARLIKTASKIIGRPVNQGFLDSQNAATVRLAQKIVRTPSHPLHQEFELLPSGRRFRVPRCQLNRTKNSLVPHAITLLNKQGGR